jgi:hypothetical protein
MIRPQPPAIMYGKAALLVWKAEFRQTAMTSSHLSSNKDDGIGVMITSRMIKRYHNKISQC